MDEHLGDDRDDRPIPKLSSFARATVHIDLSLGERYRQLAIHLEQEWLVREWAVLDSIYRVAAGIDADEALIWSSWALAEFYVNDFSESDHPRWPVLLGRARRSVQLDPSEASLWAIFGQLLYWAEELGEAETVLRKALALGHDRWSAWWLAYVLHDQKRWAEAADAYAHAHTQKREIPEWRVQGAREQRAVCLWRSGDRAGAVAMFMEVVDRYERALEQGLSLEQSPVLYVGAPRHLYDLAPSIPGLKSRVAALKHRLIALDADWFGP